MAVSDVPLSLQEANKRAEERVRARRADTPSDPCLWPAHFPDTPEGAKAFIFGHVWTYEETSGRTMQIPDHEYLAGVIDEWYATKISGDPLIIEKSRRLVASWLLCALDVWDAGHRKGTFVQGGIDYDKASDFVWRCFFIYEELRVRNKDWHLPKPSTWGNDAKRRLDMLAFPNGSIIEPLNSNGESFRGSGYTRVKLEELSAYMYIATVFSQAKAVTQGPPGVVGGHIVIVCNASVKEEWQAMKPAYNPLKPYQVLKAEKGVYVRIHYSADPSKDAAWVAKEKPGWFWGLWDLEMEMIDKALAGALWKPEWFDREDFRRPAALVKVNGELIFRKPAGIERIVVALDPTVTDPELKKNPYKDPDECGIVVVGVDDCARAHVFVDFTDIMAPEQWAILVIKLHVLFAADCIVAEKNQGGELIRLVIKTYGNAKVKLVHAADGKRTRAEPGAVLYQQGRAYHYGDLSALEAQQVTWNSKDPSQRSPGRIDALIWGLFELNLCSGSGMKVSSHKTQ